MSDNRVFRISEHGVFAEHPVRIVLPAKVAPTTEKEKNTLRDPLITVACGGLPDYKYEFDSSFIKKDVTGFIAGLAELRSKFKTNPLAVFGHADPVGSDSYNSFLSGRRAAAFYGLLVRDVDLWDDIFANQGVLTQVAPGDRWGDKALQHMLSVVIAQDGAPFYSGPQDGSLNAEYQQALNQWRKENNVSAGPASRKLLYRRYMDTVCVDKNGQIFQLTKEEFIAQGKGTKGKGDFQGCGEFNPQIVFSKEEESFFAKHRDPATIKQRDAENAPNRRVIVLFFREGTKIDPEKWPCPHVQDAASFKKCPKRFWRDGEKRRSPQEARRKFKDDGQDPQGTRDTFACRFYHGLTMGSPCEAGMELVNLRLMRRPPRVGFADVPHANRRFVVIVSQNETAAQIRGTTDAQGSLAIPIFHDASKANVRMTLKVEFNWIDETFFKPKAKPNAEITGGDRPASRQTPPAEGDGSADLTGTSLDREPADEDESRFLTMFIDIGELQEMDASAIKPVVQRLSNLHYGPLTLKPGNDGKQTLSAAEFKDALDCFKRHQRLPPDASDSQVRQRLKEVHGG